LLRLAKRVLWLAVDLVAGPRRHLAFVHFTARWCDGVGQLQEVLRLRKQRQDGAGDD
jgi:hypothetical protein